MSDRRELHDDPGYDVAPDDGSYPLHGDRGRLTREDILGQADALAQTATLFQQQKARLTAFIGEMSPSEVIFTGCGSSLNIAECMAAALRLQAGIAAQAVPASDLLFFEDALLGRCRRPLLVALSRSGQTTETALAVEAFARRFPGRSLLIDCAPAAQMAQHAGYVLQLPFAFDRAVPSTRSYTAMQQAALLLSACLSGRTADLAVLLAVEQVVAEALRRHPRAIERLALDRSWTRPIFLGSGVMFPLAREGSLKMIEIAGVPSVAYPFLEVRHGPNAVIDGETLVVGLLGQGTAEAELAVLADLRAQGATVAALCPDDEAAAPIDGMAQFAFDPVTLGALRIFQYLPVLQLLALYRSVVSGVDADRPAHVQTFVRVPQLEHSRRR